jgi:UDP-N-acetylglucosamine 2-epimerase (non-hydrolysing)
MMQLLSVCSARPNFVKLAAVHHEIVTHPDVRHIIVHTGQHYDPLFSDIFFQELKIPVPDANLGIKGGADREAVITATQEAMMPVLREKRPDIVLVYGDVNGAVGAARAAHALGIRLGHVEAGLRSFDSTMPEELNRIEIDRFADLLLVSEESGMKHLKEEGVKGKAVLVGNTMIDTLFRMRPLIEKAPFPAGLPTKFGIVTLHRPSNVDDKEMLAMNLRFLAELAAVCPLVLPLHRRTRANIDTLGLQTLLSPAIRIFEPLGYIEFLSLLTHSSFILTDSGGIQEEATFLKKKCFTLRLNTERPSTVGSGSNTLIDLSRSADRDQILTFAAVPDAVSVRVPALWDGKAGERILRAILNPS